MLKVGRVSSVLLAVVLLVCVSACKEADDASHISTPTSIPASQANVVKPNVSSVPAGWYLGGDNASLSLLEYRNNESDDYVLIRYGKVPPALVGNETSGYALSNQAAAAANFTSTAKGITAVDGKLAGWAQAYNVTADSYQTEIVFVGNNTYIEAYALCRTAHLNETRELIYSIR